MEVEYELTRDDLFSFHWRANYTSRSARRMRLKVYLSLFLILLIFCVLITISGDGFNISIVNLIVLAFPIPIIAFFFWVFHKHGLRRAIVKLVNEEKPGRGQLGRHKISLTETEIVEATDVGESRIIWAGVDRVEENDGYIFIYTTPHAAHVIPKRAFGSPGQAESFYRLASIKKEAAGSRPELQYPGSPLDYDV